MTLPKNIMLLWPKTTAAPAGFNALATAGYLAGHPTDRTSGGRVDHGHAAEQVHDHSSVPAVVVATHGFEFHANPVLVDPGEEPVLEASVPHTHPDYDLGAATPVEDEVAMTAVVSALAVADNELLHIDMKLIKASAEIEQIPQDACGLGKTGLTGLTIAQCTGTGGAPVAIKLGAGSDLNATGADTHTHALDAHHADHEGYSHRHGDTNPLDVDDLCATSAEAGVEEINEGEVDDGVQSSPDGHSLGEREMSFNRIAAAAPALTDTAVIGAVPAASTLDRISSVVLRLLQAAAACAVPTGFIGIWDPTDGEIPDGWETLDLVEDSDFVRVHADAAVERIPAAAAGHSHVADHDHLLPVHGHGTAEGFAGLLTQDASVAEGGTAIKYIPAGAVPCQGTTHGVTFKGTGSGRVPGTGGESFDELNDAAIPAFEAFVLIVKQEDPAPPPTPGDGRSAGMMMGI